MKQILTLICFVNLLTAGCAVRLATMSYAQKTKWLATERGKLTVKDAVARTRTYINISRVLLDFAAGAAQKEDTAELNAFLNQYVSAIKGARKTMVESDRDPLRRAAGYKDLEMTLRDHERRLRDIAGSLSFDERDSVEAAADVVRSVRSEMLRLLFPQRSRG